MVSLFYLRVIGTFLIHFVRLSYEQFYWRRNSEILCYVSILIFTFCNKYFALIIFLEKLAQHVFLLSYGMSIVPLQWHDNALSCRQWSWIVCIHIWLRSSALFPRDASGLTTRGWGCSSQNKVRAAVLQKDQTFCWSSFWLVIVNPFITFLLLFAIKRIKFL